MAAGGYVTYPRAEKGPNFNARREGEYCEPDNGQEHDAMRGETS